MQRYRAVLEAIYRLYEHSGFTMAGAVAFSFVVSLFPFCIFLGALSGILFGGRELADQAVAQLFQILPQGVAAGIAPQVEAIMGSTRIDLLTVSAGLGAVLRHQRDRDLAGRAQRRLPRPRDAAVRVLPVAQHAVRFRQRRLDAGADMGRRRRPGDRGPVRSVADADQF